MAFELAFILKWKPLWFARHLAPQKFFSVFYWKEIAESVQNWEIGLIETEWDNNGYLRKQADGTLRGTT